MICGREGGPEFLEHCDFAIDSLGVLEGQAVRGLGVKLESVRLSMRKINILLRFRDGCCLRDDEAVLVRS